MGGSAHEARRDAGGMRMLFHPECQLRWLGMYSMQATQTAKVARSTLTPRAWFGGGVA